MTGDGDVRHLFVYGTLRPGGDAPPGVRRSLDAGAEHLGPARTRGRLVVAGSGSYPALVRDGSGGRVAGDLYRLRDPGRVLETLDRYEGRRPDGSGLYRRAVVPVRLAGDRPVQSGGDGEGGAAGGRRLRAWTYLYNRDPSGLDEVEGGDWMQR